MYISIYLFIYLAKPKLMCAHWAKFKGKCYEIPDKDVVMSFEDAKKECAALEGLQAELPMVKTYDEQRFLRWFLLKSRRGVDNYWLGGHALTLDINGTWVWNDGTNVSYSNFFKGEALEGNLGPEKSDYKDCLEFSSQIQFPGKWFKVPCDKKNAVVCVRPAVVDPYDQVRRMLINLKISIEIWHRLVIPIGYVYIQWERYPEPDILWPHFKWTEIHVHSNNFFRVIGNQTGSWEEIQEENSPMVRMVAMEQSDDNTPLLKSIEIPKQGWSDAIYVSSTGLSTPLRRDYMKFFTSQSGEVRPRNVAVKVWIRSE